MIKFIPRGHKNPATKATMYYAEVAHVETLGLEDICRNISEVCTVTRHDVLGTLSALQEEIIKAVLSGRSVRLGDLGSFRPTITSSGSPLKNGINNSNINRIRVRFTPGSLLRNSLDLRNVKIGMYKIPVITQAGPKKEQV